MVTFDAASKMIVESVHSKNLLYFCEDCNKFGEGEWEQPWQPTINLNACSVWCSNNLVVFDALKMKPTMTLAEERTLAMTPANEGNLMPSTITFERGLCHGKKSEQAGCIASAQTCGLCLNTRFCCFEKLVALDETRTSAP